MTPAESRTLIALHLIPLAQLVQLLNNDPYKKSCLTITPKVGLNGQPARPVRKADLVSDVWDPLQLLFQDLCACDSAGPGAKERQAWLTRATAAFADALRTGAAGVRSKSGWDTLLDAAALGRHAKKLPAGLTGSTADKCSRVLYSLASSSEWARLTHELETLLGCAGSARHDRIRRFQAQKEDSEMAEFSLRSLARNSPYTEMCRLFGLSLTTDRPVNASHLGIERANRFWALAQAEVPTEAPSVAQEAPATPEVVAGSRVPAGISVTVTLDGFLEVKAALKPTDQLSKEARNILQAVPAKERSAALKALLEGVKETRRCSPESLPATLAELGAWTAARLPELLAPAEQEVRNAREALAWKTLQVKKVSELTPSEKELLKDRLVSGRF